MTRSEYRALTEQEALAASRAGWDAGSDDYQVEHGDFLGDASFVWCPEGLLEAEAGLLGPLEGRTVLEVGCGAAQCARWLRTQGARVVGVDLSLRQLQHARRIDEATGIAVSTACATATRLPIADASVDVVCSAFGALPFIVDAAQPLTEVARVLRLGGRLVFAVTHPVRWMLPDDPTEGGLTVIRSYFDRTPYVELDDGGGLAYVEAHHTIQDWVRAVHAAGLVLKDVLEPEWPSGHDRVWGGWGPHRGRLVPGTLIVTAERPR